MARKISAGLAVGLVLAALAGCADTALVAIQARSRLLRGSHAAPSGRNSTRSTAGEPNPSRGSDGGQEAGASRAGRSRQVQPASEPVPRRALPRLSGAARLARSGAIPLQWCKAPVPWSGAFCIWIDAQDVRTMAEQNFDIIIIGAGPGGYVTAIRAAQLGFKTAVVERDFLGGICLNWGCIPTKALLRSAEIFHYMQHAKDYGLSAENVGFDPRRSSSARARSPARMNNGVGFLLKKNKVDPDLGRGDDRRARASSTVKAGAERGAEGRARPRQLPGQAHHRGDRRAAARAARHRARQEAGLDLLRGHGAGARAEVAAGDRLGRHRHRVRLVLPHAGRRR